MAIETPTTLAGAIATNAIDPLVLDYARQAAYLPRLVWSRDIEGENSLTHAFPQFGALTAGAQTPGTDLSTSELDVNTAASITAAIGASVVLELTKIGAIATGGRVNLDVIARQGGLAIADRMEKDIAANFPSLSASVGTTNVAMALSDFDTALYTLRAANAKAAPVENNNAPLAASGYQCVLSEKQMQYLVTAIRATNPMWMSSTMLDLATAMGAKAADQYRGEWMGVKLWGNNDLTLANSSVDAVGAMFSTAAIGLVTVGGPKNMSVPRPLGISDQLAVYQIYGTGVVVNSYGVKIVNKNS